jgi:hypothetical protein
MLYFIVFILLGLTLMTFIVSRTSMPVEVVLAGDVNKESLVSFKKKVTIFDFFYCKSKIVNPSKYKILVVGGNSMAAKGLSERDLIFVDEFKSPAEIEALEHGDIVLLKVRENGVVNDGRLKLREFIKIIDSERIQTMSYGEDGNPKPSRPHSKATLVGKVEYKMKY